MRAAISARAFNLFRVDRHRARIFIREGNIAFPGSIHRQQAVRLSQGGLALKYCVPSAGVVSHQIDKVELQGFHVQPAFRTFRTAPTVRVKCFGAH
ncbi:hypothetical protein KCP76_24335 [Salmonella enterica subsp. enterica serovar Weltevreden]|nr:hypothetical protein KCP76_24335 [Salmonella enterica subsp. enterica serovar Weltevreden]